METISEPSRPAIGFRLTQAIALQTAYSGLPLSLPTGIEVPTKPHFSARLVLAVETVKAALVAAIAIVALVRLLLPGC